MGYNTHYSLHLDLMIGSKKAELLDDEPLREVIKKLREENEEARFALAEDGGSEQAAKWYTHADELIPFSEKYPNVLFTLSGEGEENDDIWKKYFLNGKVQVAKAEVRIPDFDPGKLA